MQDGERPELEQRIMAVSSADYERAQQAAACAARVEQRMKSLSTRSFDEDFTTGIGSEGMLHVRKLDISMSSIQRLPEAIYFLTNLQELRLFSCVTTHCDHHWHGQCQEDCHRVTLPSNFGMLERLQKLELMAFELLELPESFGQLTNLTSLYLSRIGLDRLPPTFGRLSKLQELKTFESSISELPATFGELIALKRLNISYEDGLAGLPASFSALPQLEELTIFANVHPEDVRGSFRFKELPNLPKMLVKVKLGPLECLEPLFS